VQRRDRNQYGGGLLTFIRSDFPSSRKQSLESEKIETLCHEAYISDRKWLIAGAYKPPSMSNNEFTEHFSRFVDRSLIHFEHMLLFGDLNFDMLNSDKSATLNDFCDILQSTTFCHLYMLHDTEFKFFHSLKIVFCWMESQI
jgi:hypothetical protein